MSQFLLALYDDPSTFASLSPQEIQKIIQAYSNWASQLAERGRLAGGNKLADEPGRVLRGSQEKMSAVDGPYSETKEVLGGFFIIEAENYDEAIQICRDCPHLHYGGTIELRQIEPTSEEN